MLLSNSAGISFAFEPYWEAQKEFVMSRLSPEDLPTFVSILNEKGERKAIQFFRKYKQLGQVLKMLSYIYNWRTDYLLFRRSGKHWIS